VIGALDLLRGRLAAGPESTLRLIDSALVAAERGGRLTGQLLSFSRRQNLSPVPTDLNATILALADLLTSTLGHSIHLQIDLADDLYPAMVDPSQIETALLNLALNARDAMPEGGVLRLTTARATITGSATLAAGDYVAVQIIDTGTGMDEKVAAKAIEPFFTTKSPGSGGAGLGLSQVHGIAVQSGGEVRLKSVPGIGTTVMLLLPRAVATLARPIEQPEAPRIPRGRRGRILVVDDEPGVRDMAVAMLKECGYQAEAVAGAEEALDTLADEPNFDLLLTDFVMPDMNGLALIQEASGRFPNLRSMLMTGNAELNAGDPLGADRLLLKPFNIAMLDEGIGRVLNRPKLQVIQGGAKTG
jgi:CheY-like chemotaxis protein